MNPYLFLSKNSNGCFKDFRWQIKNKSEDEGIKYANDAKKYILNDAKNFTVKKDKGSYVSRICKINESFIDYLIKKQFIGVPENFKFSKAVNKYIPIQNISNHYAYLAGLIDSDFTLRYSKINHSYEIRFALNVNRENSTLMENQLNYVSFLEGKLLPKVLCIEFRYNSKYLDFVKVYENFCKKLGFKVRLKEYNKANGIGARVEFSSNQNQEVFGLWKKEVAKYMYRQDKIDTINSMNVEFDGKMPFNIYKSEFRDLSFEVEVNSEILPDISMLARIFGYSMVSDNLFCYKNSKIYFEKSNFCRILEAKESVEDYTYDITMEEGKYYLGGKSSLGYIYDTGHPVISTFHAGSVHSMIQRLTGDPINIPISFVDNLNVVLIQSAVYVKGKIERRVLSVSEIIRYDDDVKKVLTKEVFQWDNVKDKHMFRGLYNSFILEQKVAKHMGLADPREIYSIMKKRAKIIQKMIDNDILDYFEIVKVIKKYYQEGERGLPFSIL
jgi:flagellar protein FlaI